MFQPELGGTVSVVRRATTRVNQAVFERGLTPPWVWSQARVQEYWATRTSEGSDNRPIDYADKPTPIVDFLHDFWSPEVQPTDRILELGTNAGANLAHLSRLGYRRLAGVEINPHALQQLRDSFPDLAEQADLIEGSFEAVLPTLADDSADVVFTMAVLLHVHPASNAVLDHMARIAHRHVCVIESESVTLPYIYARDYGRVFAVRGWREIKRVDINPADHPEVGRDYHGYTARLFART